MWNQNFRILMILLGTSPRFYKEIELQDYKKPLSKLKSEAFLILFFGLHPCFNV